MGVRNTSPPTVNLRPHAPPMPPRAYSRECHEDISMKEQEIQLILIRGIIASLPPESQQLITRKGND